MNGDGKSDRPIVPKRPANKDTGAPESAEPEEGRGLAKGNASQQNRRRAQDRVSLQSELERVRQAAAQPTPVRQDLRQEPGAVVPHAGICAGGRG